MSKEKPTIINISFKNNTLDDKLLIRDFKVIPKPFID